MRCGASVLVSVPLPLPPRKAVAGGERAWSVRAPLPHGAVRGLQPHVTTASAKAVAQKHVSDPEELCDIISIYALSCWFWG